MADMMNLSLLKNLVTLEVCGFPKKPSARLVDDNVVRNWGRHAESSGRFRSLRVLMLGNQEGLTSRCLTYLPMFPALAIMAINGFDESMEYPQAPPGWRCQATERFTRYTHPKAATSRGWVWRLLQSSDDPLNLNIASVSQDFEHSISWHEPMSNFLNESHDFLPASPEQSRKLPQLFFKLGSSSRFEMAQPMYSANLLLVCRTSTVDERRSDAYLTEHAGVSSDGLTEIARKRRKVKGAALQGLWNGYTGIGRGANCM